MRDTVFEDATREMYEAQLGAIDSETKANVAKIEQDWKLGVAQAKASELEAGWNYHFTAERGKQPRIEAYIEIYKRSKDPGIRRNFSELYFILHVKEKQVDSLREQYRADIKKARGRKKKQLKGALKQLNESSKIVRKYKPKLERLTDASYVESLVQRYEARLKKAARPDYIQ